ncbi:MAG: dienelactone hydrolase family protein [Ignavibacteria bacterium]|nr:dienelactone hydrolase family protein [Ignavibacteria bacterium]
MMSAKKTLELRVYNANHAFANPSNPKHDETATKSANEAAIEFFKIHLLM